MSRINLGNGSWFSPESAECFGELTWWDGRNRISVPTGSQWEHEELYRTRKGVWVLHSWSQWQGSRSTYEIVGDAQAKAWLIAAKEDEAVERYFPGAIAACEV